MNFHEFYTKIKDLGLTFLISRASQKSGDNTYVAPVQILVIKGEDNSYKLPPVYLRIIAQTDKMIELSNVKHFKDFDKIHSMKNLPKNWSYTYLLMSKDNVKPLYLMDDFTYIYEAIEKAFKAKQARERKMKDVIKYMTSQPKFDDKKFRKKNGLK